MNVHAVMSTVAPALICPPCRCSPLFPQWLGKNSTTGKKMRLLSEMQAHMRTAVSADKSQIRLEYIPHLIPSLTLPLVSLGQQAIEDVIEVMDEYCITREDWASMLEIDDIQGRDSILSSIPSTVKSAFTRKYNSDHHLAKIGAAMEKSGASSRVSDYEESEPSFSEPLHPVSSVDEEEEDEDDFKTDKLIKKKSTKETSCF
eukprot:TRINITY_DN24294_c0_g1_i1.p1 TRINITY_DN24294_c0_g1~~TRINITY_DN24294_c0_g1_i1.p1  ORF type:complete len:202 (-),score=56.96 TRINITY_DN24294_c0_g1_i1:44-649(-)